MLRLAPCLLALLLLAGCSSPPKRTGPFTSTSVSKAVLVFGEKVHGRTATGWPKDIPTDDDLPLVKVGELNNRSDLEIDPRAFMTEIARQLEEKGYVVVDDDAKLVVRGTLEHKKKDNKPDDFWLTLLMDETDRPEMRSPILIEISRLVDYPENE